MDPLVYTVIKMMRRISVDAMLLLVHPEYYNSNISVNQHITISIPIYTNNSIKYNPYILIYPIYCVAFIGLSAPRSFAFFQALVARSAEPSMAGATSWQHALRMREVPSDVGFFGWFWLDKILDLDVLVGNFAGNL